MHILYNTAFSVLLNTRKFLNAMKIPCFTGEQWGSKKQVKKKGFDTDASHTWVTADPTHNHISR